MAYTLLDAVNRVLKRTGYIQGDAGELTSLTDSARQRSADITVQIINEAMQRLYVIGALRGEVKSSSITLVTSTREYALASDWLQFHGETYWQRVLTNSTNGRRLYEYPGGYAQMFADQPDASDFTGEPVSWALTHANPQRVRMSHTPTSDENGDVYNYLYEAEIAVSTAAATFPFPDTVFDHLLPAIADMVKSEDMQEGAASVMDGKQARTARPPVWAHDAFVGAIRLLRGKRRRRYYGVERVGG